MNERRCETKQEGQEKKKKKGTGEREREREKARIRTYFTNNFFRRGGSRHRDAHLPRNSRSPAIVHRGNYYSHFCDACSRSSLPGWRKITSSPRNHQKKVATVQRAWKKRRKKGGKKISFPRWTRENRRETAFLPVKIIYVYVCVCVWNSFWKSRRGEKRNENVRRGGKRKRKPGNRLDSRKGLSTFSHDTICCRHLTDNASAGAKYVFQLYLFPSFPFLSSRPLLPSRNCQTIEVSRECATAYAVVWASSCSWIGLNSVCWDEKGLERRGGGAFEVVKRYSHGGRGWKFVEIFFLVYFYYCSVFLNFSSLFLYND